MKKYLIGTLLCLSSLNLLAAEGPIDSDDDADDNKAKAAVAAASVPTPRSAAAAPSTLIVGTGPSTAFAASSAGGSRKAHDGGTPVDYNEIMKRNGYTQSLTSKPAMIGAASGLVVARLAKASMPVTVALTGAGYGIGIMYKANEKLRAVALAQMAIADNRTAASAASDASDAAQLENYYYGQPAPANSAFLDKAFYVQAVKQLPICCVDVFVYDRTAQKYFMVKRGQEPMKGSWWLPGGRLNFGEAPEDCAKRKCKDEVGLTIQPVDTLGAYSTTFDTSAWGCPTHTVNMAILAFGTSKETVTIDSHHAETTWNPIAAATGTKYLGDVYYAAVRRLKLAVTSATK